MVHRAALVNLIRFTIESYLGLLDVRLFFLRCSWMYRVNYSRCMKSNTPYVTVTLLTVTVFLSWQKLKLLFKSGLDGYRVFTSCSHILTINVVTSLQPREIRIEVRPKHLQCLRTLEPRRGSPWSQVYDAWLAIHNTNEVVWGASLSTPSQAKLPQTPCPQGGWLLSAQLYSCCQDEREFLWHKLIHLRQHISIPGVVRSCSCDQQSRTSQKEEWNARYWVSVL